MRIGRSAGPISDDGRRSIEKLNAEYHATNSNWRDGHYEKAPRGNASGARESQDREPRGHAVGWMYTT
jgi:hypothetical protein